MQSLPRRNKPSVSVPACHEQLLFQSHISKHRSGTSAMAFTTTEMFSNQISNWLSQISNDFDVDFVYRPGTKDINSQELQVALSTQLLTIRLL